MGDSIFEYIGIGGLVIVLFVFVLPAFLDAGVCDIDEIVLSVVEKQIILEGQNDTWLSPETKKLLNEVYAAGSVEGCQAVALLDWDKNGNLKSLKNIKNHGCDVAKCIDEVLDGFRTGE